MDLKERAYSLLKGESSVGIFLKLDSVDGIQFDLIKTQRNKGIIEITDQQFDLPLTSISEYVSSQEVCYLSIVGSAIIHKKAVLSPDQKIEDLVTASLPQVKINDLYCQYLSSNSSGFLSIVRKNVIDEILDELSSLSCCVIKVILGPFSLDPILKLQNKIDSIEAPPFKLKIVNQGIESIEKIVSPSTSKYLFGDQEIESRQLLPYATSLTHFIGFENLSEINTSTIRRGKNEFIHQRIFKKSFIAAPVFLLTLLIINFGLFSYYSSENNELRISYSSQLAKSEKIGSLGKDLEIKEKLLSLTASPSTSLITFFADEIASNMVEGIQLTELEIYPINQFLLSNERRIEFEYNKIKIVGNCYRPEELSSLINKLNALEWVKDISSPNYKWNEFSKKGIFNFEIKLK